MKIFLALITVLAIWPATAKVKVAVIDTGFDFNSTWVGVEKEKTFDGESLRKPKLCKDGHKDFTGTGINDSHGHGTHVSGIIGTYAGDADYCLVIIKYFNPGASKNLTNTIKAFEFAIASKVDVINYSGGGVDFSLLEYNVVKKALDKGIVIVAAAGNERTIINRVIHDVKKENNIIKVTYLNNITLDFDTVITTGYYPANYDKRVFSVVNLLSDGITISPSSNKGAAFTHSAVGTNVKSILPNNKVGILSGTSQAAPKITSKIIKGLQDTK